MSCGSVRGWLRCTRSAVQKNTSPFFGQEAFIGHGLSTAGGIQFGGVQFLVIVAEVDPFRAALEQIVRQAVAFVVEGQFAAALDHVFQGDPGCRQQHRVFDRYNRGVLMDAMTVAPLEQQLLEGDRVRVEHQGQEAGDAGVEADLPRGFQIDVEIEQALEPVGRLSRQFPVGQAGAMVGGQEFTRMQVMAVDVGGEAIDEARVDCA